jgi:hypothetical protein
MALADFDGNAVEQIGARSAAHGLLKRLSRDPAFKAVVDGRTLPDGDNIPAFRFGFAFAHSYAGLGVRVNLNAQNILSVKEFD